MFGCVSFKLKSFEIISSFIQQNIEISMIHPTTTSQYTAILDRSLLLDG
jgi:hypothetical protein